MIKSIGKFVFGALIGVGLLMVIGTAGADCDGKCMENALPLGQMLIQVAIGLVGMAAGALGLAALSD
jgi:hypothetical protein